MTNIFVKVFFYHLSKSVSYCLGPVRRCRSWGKLKRTIHKYEPHIKLFTGLHGDHPHSRWNRLLFPLESAPFFPRWFCHLTSFFSSTAPLSTRWALPLLTPLSQHTHKLVSRALSLVHKSLSCFCGDRWHLCSFPKCQLIIFPARTISTFSPLCCSCSCQNKMSQPAALNHINSIIFGNILRLINIHFLLQAVIIIIIVNRLLIQSVL